MKTLFAFCVLLSLALLHGQESPFYSPTEDLAVKPPTGRALPVNQPRLHFNNRPLAQMNGKTISLMDVVNKMDLALFDYNPDLLTSTITRYQFYTQSWQAVLEEMIQTEMILLDGEEKQIKVSEGEIREAMLERFGINIIATLEEIGLTYEEAREMVRKELIVEQLMSIKVHLKAIQEITPEVIRKSYADYLSHHLCEEKWLYDVLSIRGKNQEACEKIGQIAYQLLEKGGKKIEEIAQELKEEGVQVSIAREISADEKSLSTEHRNVLQILQPQSFSRPLTQLSRFDQSAVVRLFYLHSHDTPAPLSFEQGYDQIKGALMSKKMGEAKSVYVEQLKKRFSFDQHNPRFPLPESYTPFVLY